MSAQRGALAPKSQSRERGRTAGRCRNVRLPDLGNLYTDESERAKETQMTNSDRYDNSLSVSRVLYDELRDGFVCAFCLDDFTFSQLHATFGGDILPMPIQLTSKTARALASEPCLICDLSCSRFLDD